MPKGKTSFTSENQPKNRKTRGKCKRTMIIDALKAQGKTEDQFWEAVVERALSGDDAQMMTLVAKKLFPDTKATYDKYNINIKKGANRLDRAEAILQTALTGDIPIDVAERFLTSLADVAKVEEVDSILERLAVIEEALKNE